MDFPFECVRKVIWKFKKIDTSLISMDGLVLVGF